MQNIRQKFLRSLLEIDVLKGLEIGALDSPLVVPEDLVGDGEVFYLDHLSTDGLRHKYREDKTVNLDEIVSVDFVCSDTNLLDAVNGNTFDYVVASHVIEHSPNMLKFLEDTYKILKPGGLLFLVIPDKRFTFDINRPETTFGELLESYFYQNTRPRIGSVYDHFANAINVDAHSVWFGNFKKAKANLLASRSFAWTAAKLVKKEDEYYDVHVNIFTPYGFFETLNRAISHELFMFEVEDFVDTSISQLEFFVALRKPEMTAPEKVKADCLKKIPHLKIDSVLSPYMPQVKALSEALKTNTEISESLRREVQDERRLNELNNLKLIELKANLELAQRSLDRRSVKFILGLVHKMHSILNLNLFRKG